MARSESDGAPRVRSLRQELPPLLAVAILLGLLSAFYAGDNFALSILTNTFLFAGLATAWNMIGGYGGQFSLCHGVFFAEGAYLTANLVVHLGLSPWLALPPAALLAAATAVAISWPAFRLRGPFFAIATMTFNEVMFVLANYADPITGGSQGMRIPFHLGFANMIFLHRINYTIIMLGFLLVTLLASLTLLRSRLGYYLQAVRDNEAAARACGIGVLRTKLTGFAISAAFTGIGGCLFVMYVRIIDPPSLFTLSDIGVRFALIALIGGVGTGYGPLLGALLVVPLEALLRSSLGGYAPGSNLVVLGAVLILAALFLKRGLMGAIEDITLQLRGRRARGSVQRVPG